MLISRQLLLLWGALQFSLLALLHQAFSWWMLVLYAALLVFRTQQLLRASKALTLKQVNVLAVVMLLALLSVMKQSGVLHFMLQILLLAAILRWLALVHSNEARQLVWVQYFLLGCCFIVHQDMLIALLILLALGANIYGHYRLFSAPDNRIRWQQSGKSLLLIIPLWLAMFLLFPRLSPFWQIPSAKVASTGLSDSLDPGSIEQLVQDDSLAFRVEFDGAMPARALLYWRSWLYEDFDGRRWQVNPLRQQASRANAAALALPPATQSISYRIIAEASQQRNLFALAFAQRSDGQVFIAPSGLVSAQRPVSQRLSYRVDSALMPVALIAETERSLNLQVPSGNDKTREFARQLAVQYPQPQALIQALERHFNQQAYYYSLTPPPLGANSVDQFLFESRSGFCSHYASATALILRAAGIPARVVGGYQGGVWHQQQGYLAVRQREAHAWVEYLYNEQWQMFDPTAAVAPERILDSLESALPSEQQDKLRAGWRQLELLQQLRTQLMHLDYYWSVWVLGFNENDQQQLWQKLRQHIALITTTIAVLLTLVLLGVYLLWRRPKPTVAHAASRLMLRQFGPALARKQAGQSLSARLQQLALQHSEHQYWLQPAITAYEQTVFSDDKAAFHRLQQLLKQHSKPLRILRRRSKNT